MLKYILNLSEPSACSRVISARTKLTLVVWHYELVLCSWGSLNRLLTKLVLQNMRRGGEKAVLHSQDPLTALLFPALHSLLVSRVSRPNLCQLNLQLLTPWDPRSGHLGATIG